MPTFSSVVVGTDGSDSAAEAVHHAMDLAKLCGAKLHIVTGYKPKAVRTAGIPEEYREHLGPGGHADTVLDDQCARARQAGIDVTGHAEPGDPADGIVRVAEREKADVIVVGNKGMAGARRALGSVPNSVAHKAPCAVFIVQTS